MNMLFRIVNRIANIPNSLRINEYKKMITGKNYRLGYEVYMQHPENIQIGNETYINSGLIYASPNAYIKIGDNCLISYNVHIRTDSHNYKKRDEYIKKQGHCEKSIVIGNDVWIGYGAQIMPGCEIKDGTVIGAGAVVTHSTEKYGVYGGCLHAKLEQENNKRMEIIL